MSEELIQRNLVEAPEKMGDWNFYNIGATTLKALKGAKIIPDRDNKIKSELSILCKSHSNEFITTMFDYYAMPSNTPGIDNQDPDIIKRIEAIEATVDSDIGMRNCSFHFMLHEFEGILFSNPASFNLIADESTVDKVQAIRDSFPTPEHINNSPETAPSKRLEQLIPGYAKVRNGSILSKDMGIDTIIRECPHFREWIKQIAKQAEDTN